MQSTRSLHIHVCPKETGIIWTSQYTINAELLFSPLGLFIPDFVQIGEYKHEWIRT